MPAEWHEEGRQSLRRSARGDLRVGRVRDGRGAGGPGVEHHLCLEPEGHLATDGPFAEAKEQLAGFFLIDCETRQRAEEIAAQFAQPGGTVELRPAMWGDGDD